MRYEHKLPVPISSFPFPTITLIRAPALATQTVTWMPLGYNPYLIRLNNVPYQRGCRTSRLYTF
jgi:hypothetical protein